jgi:hypothetical protein
MHVSTGLSEHGHDQSVIFYVVSWNDVILCMHPHSYAEVGNAGEC